MPADRATESSALVRVPTCGLVTREQQMTAQQLHHVLAQSAAAIRSVPTDWSMT